MPSDDEQLRAQQAARQLVWQELSALAEAIAAGPSMDVLRNEITLTWVQRTITAQLRLIQRHELDAGGRCLLCRRRECTVAELLSVYAESWLVTGELDTNLHPTSSVPFNPADPGRWRHRRAELGS